MMRVRPVRLQDHTEMLALARLAGIGMTSLPPDSHVLKNKIEHAVLSFQGKPAYPKGESFLFVLEDTERKKLIGSTGLVAHVGVSKPFYSYKLSTIVQACSFLEVYSMQRVLHMVNDYTGASEIGSLFVLPEYRRDGVGRFLSRCRYLMLAEFPEMFSDTVLAEIRGVQDADGESPFYNYLAKPFFHIDYKRADFVLATQGGQFIADLMPKYPVYVALLHEAARSVIGVPLEASRPAKSLLEREGFAWQGYVDVLDAGPTIQAARANIRTVQNSKRRKVEKIEPRLEGEMHMIANTVLEHFTVARGQVQELSEESVAISTEAAQLLNVQTGDYVRYAL